MNTYTDEDFWTRFHDDSGFKHHHSIPFTDLFRKHLSPDPSQSVLEVGCGGGEFLAHLAQHFDYRAYGIDFSEGIEKTRGLFQQRGLPEPKLYREDFFSWQSAQTFDLVCSFGFIEHFPRPREVVARHAALMKPGGKLIFTLPNFAGLQYLFHLLVEPEMLKHHNISVMNLKVLRDAVEAAGLKILHLNYYGAFGFWTVKPPKGPYHKGLYKTIHKTGKFLKRCFRYRPNHWISPHIACVAQKPDSIELSIPSR